MKIDLTAFLSMGALLSLDSERLLVGWGNRQWTKEPESFPCWFFPQFFYEDSHLYFEHEHTSIISRSELLNCLGVQSGTRLQWGDVQWQPFEKAIREIKSNGTLTKIVPYVQKKALGKVSTRNVLSAALSYQARNLRTFVYGYWGDEEGVLGVTPELLARADGSALSTMAVAGTVPVKRMEELLQDAKLKHEHQIVVDSICQDLNPFGKLEIGDTEPHPFSSIAHLVTPIKLTNCSASFDMIVRTLHPTPALGAYPKEKGWDWLKQYAQNIPRRRYGAPAGVCLGPNEGFCYVAIRNMQWQQDLCTLTAGCGITAASVIEKEKDEIMAKFSAIQEILKV